MHDEILLQARKILLRWKLAMYKTAMTGNNESGGKQNNYRWQLH